MNVLLINPTSLHEIKGPHPFLSRDMGVFPHLGLMYIASVLRMDDEFNVELFDMPLENRCIEDLIKLFRNVVPSVVGITSYSDCLYDLKLIIEALRRESTTVTICVGGPHVEIYPEETLKFFKTDCVIQGDGEYSFRELCRRVRDGGKWRDIDGVGYVDDGRTIINRHDPIASLDQLPFPSRDLANMKKVSYAMAGGNRVTSICSSRGCPFPCTFCISHGKRYRMRSADNVAKEIRHCYEKMALNEFFFFDDLFNFKKERLLEICDAIDRLPFKIKWSFRGRINALDEEALRRCKACGCIRIHFGVESGTERIQKLYKKNMDLDEVRKVFGLCKKLGIETIGNFMIGAPTETREEIHETFRFAHELGPTYVEYHVLVPYPHTEIYKEMLNNGYLRDDEWVNYARNPYPGFKPPLCNETLSRDELYRLLNRAYRKYYFRLAYILKKIVTVKNLFELKKNIFGAYRLLTVTKNDS